MLTEAIAEFTWALILGDRRGGSPKGDRLVRRGGWKGWALDFMLGMELRGKQLGIIGRGRIGRAVAAKAPAFGMNAVFAARGDRTAASTSCRSTSCSSRSDVVSHPRAAARRRRGT